jgi:hypothetical protein
VGGLADVVTGLGRALQKKGHLVEFVLPKYDCMDYSRVQDLKVSERCPKPLEVKKRCPKDLKVKKRCPKDLKVKKRCLRILKVKKRWTKYLKVKERCPNGLKVEKRWCPRNLKVKKRCVKIVRLRIKVGVATAIAHQTIYGSGGPDWLKLAIWFISQRLRLTECTLHDL